MAFAFDGEYLRRVRIGSKVSQGNLAKSSGIPQSVISKFELNKRVPSEDDTKALAKALGVNAALFFNDSESTPVDPAPKGSVDLSQEDPAKYLDVPQSTSNLDILVIDWFADGSFLVKYDGMFYKAVLTELS